MSRHFRKFRLMNVADPAATTGAAAAAAPAAAADPAAASAAAALTAGAPAAAASAAAALAAPPPAAGATPPEWFAGFQNAELKTWITGKGFKAPEAVAESAYNLEKLLGHDRAGRTLVIPKDDSPAEEVAAYHAKIGVPAKPEDYKFEIPPGADPGLAKEAAAWMHKNAVPAKSAQGVVNDWNAYMAKAAADQTAAVAAKNAAEMTALQTEWGQAFTPNMELAKRATNQFLNQYLPGTNDAERKASLEQIERFMGTDKMLKMLQNLGSRLGEHQVINSGSPQGGGAVLAPAEAKTKIAQLMADPVWAKAYREGGMKSAQFEEMTRLQKMAYPAEEGGIDPRG